MTKSSERDNTQRAEVDTQRTAVEGLHTVSEDAMALLKEVKADNAELRDQVKALLADNEAIRCRVRELEEKVQTMTVSFSKERAGWQQEIRRLKHENRALEAAGYGRGTGYDPTIHDDPGEAEGE